MLEYVRLYDGQYPLYVNMSIIFSGYLLEINRTGVHYVCACVQVVSIVALL